MEQLGARVLKILLTYDKDSEDGAGYPWMTSYDALGSIQQAARSLGLLAEEEKSS
jgi:hypothetical protein